GLSLGNAAALGTGALNVSGLGGTLSASLPGLNLGNAINLGAGASLGIGGANDLSLSGIVGGAGGLNFGGTGTLALN
ncbi:hypothetical protein HKX41_14100, partial [Salinisphaera sp. USBA-960]|nr:hypothetical protein [Salifodinibacter halophilus]